MVWGRMSVASENHGEARRKSPRVVLARNPPRPERPFERRAAVRSRAQYQSQKSGACSQPRALWKMRSTTFLVRGSTLRVALAGSSEDACWQQRTPAMAAQLTDHIWTVKELLTVVLVPHPSNS